MTLLSQAEVWDEALSKGIKVLVPPGFAGEQVLGRVCQLQGRGEWSLLAAEGLLSCFVLTS